MARQFKELLNKMTPERRARIKAGANRLREELILAELRESRALTQQQLARALRINQAAVSKMERRKDMYLSSLDGIIKAMGGRLEIRAVFPDRVVRISRGKRTGKRS
ncbi:MAG: XRE family transcriptional regulator [Candidatus Acidiferrales bacterium]